MNVYFTFIVLFLLFLLYVFDEYLGYLDENEIEYEKETYNNYELYFNNLQQINEKLKSEK